MQSRGACKWEEGDADVPIRGRKATIAFWALKRGGVISVTKALLNNPTGEVMNTTMDKDSFGTLLMDDPGDGDPNAGLWWTDVDYAMRSSVHDCGG